MALVALAIVAFAVGFLALVPLRAGAQTEPSPVPTPISEDAEPAPLPTPTKLEPSPTPEPKPRHDHSRKAMPRRPGGLYGLKRLFGRPCGRRANDGRTYYPSARRRGRAGYIHYHRRLARNVGRNVVGHMRRRKRLAAADYGVWGYACRAKVGSTGWSVHSWGAAIDTNTLRNPWGQRRWNGRGSNGRNYRRYLPRVWIRHNFYWGLWFSGTKDPMHFQYVSGY